MNRLYIGVALFFILAFVLAINFAVNYLGHLHYKENDEILDQLQMWLPNLHKYEYLTDYVIFAFVGSLFFIKESDTFFWNFLVRILLILVLRAITTISTILPKDKSCTTDFSSFVSYLRGGCYDKIFSGHMSIVTLFSLMYFNSGIFDALTFWLVTMSYGLFIIASRGHYTADVVLGFLITYLVYDGDYTAVNTIAKPLYKLFMGGK